ncbi:MAG: hypothetical protein HXS46_18475 [Theionarchaea archaeon]|nr:hypothetical protein [Theionarchaea archaeon]
MRDLLFYKTKVDTLKLSLLKGVLTREVEGEELDIELNLSSLEAYFHSTELHIKWMKIAEEVGFESVSSEKRTDSEEWEKRALLGILHQIGITTIGELDKMLRDASQWGKDVLAQFRKISPEDFTPEAYTYIAVFILVLYSRKDFVNQIDYKKLNIAPGFIVAIKRL